MSRLLLDEHPLMVMPKLAKAIGLNEAIVLQQIHYWNEMNKKTNNNFKDGYHWTFNSYDGWQEQFPFWSESTIKRTIRSLENSGLVIVGNYNKLKIDRTKWYRIDYKKLDKWGNIPIGQNDLTRVSNCTDQQTKMNRPLPETTPETKTEIKLKINNPSSDELRMLNIFTNCFKRYFGYEHRKINTIPDLSALSDCEDYDMALCFNSYFEKYGNGNKKDNLEKCSINNVIATFPRYENGCGSW